MAHQSIAVGFASHFDFSSPAQRDGEIHDFIVDTRVDIDGRRQRVVVGKLKGRAVGKHAGRAAQGDLADGQQIALELDRRESPAVWDQRLTATLDITLEIALLLLKVLRLQE